MASRAVSIAAKQGGGATLLQQGGSGKSSLPVIIPQTERSDHEYLRTRAFGGPRPHSSRALGAQMNERSSPVTTTLLPCPFCGSSSVDPEGWMSCEPDGSNKRTGPACDDCGASAASDERWNTRDWTPDASIQPAHTLNQQAAEHPPFDNPRDPFASPERIPSVGGDAVAATPRDALKAVQHWDAHESNPASYGGLPKRIRSIVDAALSGDAAQPSIELRAEIERQVADYDVRMQAAHSDAALSESGLNNIIRDLLAKKLALKRILTTLPLSSTEPRTPEFNLGAYIDDNTDDGR